MCRLWENLTCEENHKTLSRRWLDFIAVFGYGWHLRDVYLGFNASTDAGDAFFPRDTLENYGEQILDELKRKDVKFAVISRAGQAREKLPEGVMFTHSAFFRRNAASDYDCLLYTSPSPRDQRGSRMPSSA